MIIVYPADYFDNTQIDPDWIDEAHLFKNQNFKVFSDKEKLPENQEVLYRGWMKNLDEYKELSNWVEKNSCSLLISPKQYQSAHHIPFWYSSVDSLNITPKSYFAKEADVGDLVDTLDWDSFFVKDYVKSLTTNRGSIAKNKDEVFEILTEMGFYRNIEGGVCLRQVHNFLPESERRFFVFKGNILSNGDIPDIVKTVRDNFNHPFFSVDIIKDAEGRQWLVEIGDGQVSDLKHPWKRSDFVSLMAKFA